MALTPQPATYSPWTFEFDAMAIPIKLAFQCRLYSIFNRRVSRWNSIRRIKKIVTRIHMNTKWERPFGWLLVWLLTITQNVHVQIFHFYPVIFRWKFISFFYRSQFSSVAVAIVLPLSFSMNGTMSPVTDVYVMRTLNTIFLPLHLLFILKFMLFTFDFSFILFSSLLSILLVFFYFFHSFLMWGGSFSFFFTLLFWFILETVENEEHSLTSAKRQKMQEN